MLSAYGVHKTNQVFEMSVGLSSNILPLDCTICCLVNAGRRSVGGHITRHVSDEVLCQQYTTIVWQVTEKLADILDTTMTKRQTDTQSTCTDRCTSFNRIKNKKIFQSIWYIKKKTNLMFVTLDSCQYAIITQIYTWCGLIKHSTGDVIDLQQIASERLRWTQWVTLLFGSVLGWAFWLSLKPEWAIDQPKSEVDFFVWSEPGLSPKVSAQPRLSLRLSPKFGGLSSGSVQT